MEEPPILVELEQPFWRLSFLHRGFGWPVQSDVAGLGLHHLPHRVRELLRRVEHHAVDVEGRAVRARVHSVDQQSRTVATGGVREQGLSTGEPLALCVHTGVHHAHRRVVHRLLLRHAEVQRVRAVPRFRALSRGCSVHHGGLPRGWAALHGQRVAYDSADTPVRQTAVLGSGVRGGQANPDPILNRGILHRGVKFGREGGGGFARRGRVSKLHTHVIVICASSSLYSMPLLEGGAICSELSRSLPSPLGLLFLAIFGQKPVDGLARQEYGRVQGKRPQERHLDTPHKHPGSLRAKALHRAVQ